MADRTTAERVLALLGLLQQRRLWTGPELAERLGVTAVVVSHDPSSMFAVADRIALLYQGVVHVVAAPDELRASGDPIVQQFIAGRSSGPMETPGF